MSCFMIKRSPGFGGNSHSDPGMILRRTAALGDVLCATAVADKLAERGFEVTFQAHPSTHCLLRRVASISSVTVPNGFAHVDLDGSYESDPNRRKKHFHQMFFESANNQLRARGLDIGAATNCKPKLRVHAEELERSRRKFSQYPRPWVFMCPRSNSYNVRQVPDYIWEATARLIPGTCFWLGTHPAPAGIIDLECRHMDNLIIWLAVADHLITVDTGPIHVAAAMGIPIVGLGQSSFPDWHLNDQNDFITLHPEGKLNCLDCQLNLCPVNNYTPPCQIFSPELISSTVIGRLTKGKISAAISVFQPELDTINRCLECVLPQVDEVVICHDQKGYLPAGVKTDPKIRVIKKQLNDIGYGRKQNFAVRHTTGEFVLLLNDDVFLDPGSVGKLMEVMTPGVGMVSNHLRYPDGTIYHAGKLRNLGEMGWHHRDYKKYIPTLEKPTELENCCGACVLVRREAFYKSDGFDEDFYIFAEDDAMCLAMRREGWKIMFTPHSTGVHMEHQSVKKTGDITGLLHRANAAFHRKWNSYLEWNKGRVPGNFEYLK